MTFTDLLAKIAEGSEKYYLSTQVSCICMIDCYYCTMYVLTCTIVLFFHSPWQDAVVDEEEVPFPVTAPLSALLSDIPLNPSLLQGMVPSSYNMCVLAHFALVAYLYQGVLLICVTV